MINQILIKNFRTYGEAIINLSPQLTAIVGLPQSGKTNILRAIELVRTNKPLGNKFKPKFLKQKKIVPSITITTDTDVISFEKQNTKSIYSLNNGEKLSAGQNVPVEIDQALNLSDTNFQHQIDRAFLITDTPGEVIKTINKITNLENVDDWFKEINREITQKNTRIEIYQKENEEKEIELSKLKNVDRLNILLEEIEKNEDELNQLKRDEQNLISFESEYKTIENKINQFSNISKIDLISKKIKTIEIQRHEKINLQNVIIDYIDTKNRIDVLKNKTNPINKIIESINDLKTQIDDSNDLYYLLSKYDEILKKSDQNESLLLLTEDRIESELTKQKVCEFCGTELTKGKINEIIESI